MPYGRLAAPTCSLRAGADIFLDSSDLIDFRHLINDGVLESEVLVFLASPTVLQSFYCLIELYSAHQIGLPVLLVRQPGWDASAALRFLDNLEESIDDEGGAKAVGKLRRMLAEHDERFKSDTPTTLQQLGDGVRAALNLQVVAEACGGGGGGASPASPVSAAAASSAAPSASLDLDLEDAPEGGCRQSHASPRSSCAAVSRESSASRRGSAVSSAAGAEEGVDAPPPLLLELDMYCTDQQMLASVLAIIDAMASLTGRELSWEARKERKALAEQIASLTGRPMSSAFAGVGSALQRCLRDLCGRQADEDEFRAFIACDVEDPVALDVACYLQAALQSRLDGPVVMEEPHVAARLPSAEDEDAHATMVKRSLMALLDDGVGRSSGLLLVQTAAVMSRPGTLLQVHEALRLRKPVFTVVVSGGGYDFESVNAILERLQRPAGTPAVSPWMRRSNARLSGALSGARHSMGRLSYSRVSARESLTSQPRLSMGAATRHVSLTQQQTERPGADEHGPYSVELVRELLDEREDETWRGMIHALKQVVPNIKSFSFNPLAAVRVKQAAVEDLAYMFETFSRASEKAHRARRGWERLVLALLEPSPCNVQGDSTKDGPLALV